MGERNQEIHKHQVCLSGQSLMTKIADPKLLESIYKQIESRYRNIKKHIEVIADSFVKENISVEYERAAENLKIGEKIYLAIVQKYANCQKEKLYPQDTSKHTAALEAMIGAVKTMVESLTSKPKVNVLKKLCTILRWLAKVLCHMKERAQTLDDHVDKEEQLQRF